MFRNACKIKKAHILSPGDRGWGGGGGHIKIVSKNPIIELFFWEICGKKSSFLDVLERQNMSFLYFASIPKACYVAAQLSQFENL